MTTVDCRREQDVLDALVSSRWPDRADDELRTHVATCVICADVVEVAGAVLAESGDACGDMHIPSSAVMWWRAQMRARQEAARAAARPITVAQAVAAVTAITLIVAALVAFSPSLAGWLRAWMSGAATGIVAGVQAPGVLLLQGWLLPALIIGVWLVLAPLAIYFAVAEE